MIARLTYIVTAVMAAALMSTGCGSESLGDESLGECPPYSQNQQDFGASVLYTTCTGCHSSELEGAARQGAPVGSDYDNPEMVRPQAEEIYEWAQSGTMPPDGGLNEDQIENVRVYLACGAP